MSYDNRLQIHQGEDYNTLIVLVTDASLDTINLSGYTGYQGCSSQTSQYHSSLLNG